MDIKAIILARGGSKGIKRKNIVSLLGKPLISYTIKHAINTEEISEVYVSTDDDKIVRIAAEYGARIIIRPPNISGDYTPSEDALKHFLMFIKREKKEPDYVVFLQPTSPIRRKYDISNAIDRIISTKADSLLSTRKIEGFIWVCNNNIINPINYEPRQRPMRQERQTNYEEENGSIYIFKPWVLEKYNTRIGGKVVNYPMDIFSSIQIDEQRDIEIAERVLSLLDS